jgi:hypothetical protein
MKRNIAVAITLIMVIIALGGCSHLRESEYADFQYTVYLDNAEIDRTKTFGDFFERPRTIMLKDDSVALYRIDKLIGRNDGLYVMDIPAKLVAKFDMDGNFVRRYGIVGRGPGEYVSISDFTVDTVEGKLYILDYNAANVLCYDLDTGRYIERIDCKTVGQINFRVASVGTRLYTNVYSTDVEKEAFMLKSYDKHSPDQVQYHLLQEEHIPGWDNSKGGNIITGRFFYGMDSRYNIFSNKYSDRVMRVGENGVENYIYVKSDDFVDNKTREDISAGQNASELFNRLEIYHDVHDYFETSAHIVFRIREGNSLWSIVLDKNSGTASKVPYMKNDLILNEELGMFGINMRFGSQSPDGVYYYADALYIRQIKDYFVEGVDKLDELRQLPEDANPVVFYYNFK